MLLRDIKFLQFTVGHFSLISFIVTLLRVFTIFRIEIARESFET